MKTYSHILMAILLSLSILAPALMEIINVDLGIETSQNIGDEESEKEGKKGLEELEEKKLNVLVFSFSDSSDFTSRREDSFRYLGSMQDLVRSIVLPPPEQA
ncbi:MAG: hypothetical protein ACI9FY_000801 [Patiriisocius sp.]|jgi:hypothetical protein